MITVYTKDGCPQCDKAKALLTSKGEEFKAVKIGADMALTEFRMAYPHVKSVPFIVNGDAAIGGFNELNKLLADK